MDREIDLAAGDGDAALDALDDADLDSLASLDDADGAAPAPPEPPEGTTMRRAKPSEDLFDTPGSDLSIFGDSEDDEV
jgi:hypothetical protein